jgi:hypothetical protein
VPRAYIYISHIQAGRMRACVVLRSILTLPPALPGAPRPSSRLRRPHTTNDHQSIHGYGTSHTRCMHACMNLGTVWYVCARCNSLCCVCRSAGLHSSSLIPVLPGPRWIRRWLGGWELWLTQIKLAGRWIDRSTSYFAINRTCRPLHDMHDHLALLACHVRIVCVRSRRGKYTALATPDCCVGRRRKCPNLVAGRTVSRPHISILLYLRICY